LNGLPFMKFPEFGGNGFQFWNYQAAPAPP
jgi:hypothetical protein